MVVVCWIWVDGLVLIQPVQSQNCEGFAAMAMVEDTKGASTSGNADDVDERTVFVRSLPYTVTDGQVRHLLALKLGDVALISCSGFRVRRWVC